ncbi:MAG TPA: AraC family transcriptional regulator [Puia sp.]|nr:AraC family transcriptional regulator [Puia sp.]
MFQLDIDHTNFEELTNDLAQRLNARVEKDRIKLPEAYASGVFSFVILPNGMHVNIADFIFNQDCLINRQKTHEQYYILRFHDLTIPDMLEIRIGNEWLKETRTSRQIAYLSNTLTEWAYFAAKGTIYKGINILFNSTGLAEQLGVAQLEDVLSTYLSLEIDNINREPLDIEYKRLMQEIMDVEETNPLRLAVIQNRVMLLIERFFLRLYERRKNHYFHVPMSKADIDRVMQVEATLTKDIFEPAPTINQLARMVSISESKLKKDFKLIYGLPVFEYFQKVRMQAAKDKLLGGNYSVKEVAMELGYSNLSNFTIAFKKEFGLLPSKLLSSN